MPIDLAAFRERALSDPAFFKRWERTMEIAAKHGTQVSVPLLNGFMEVEGLRYTSPPDKRD